MAGKTAIGLDIGTSVVRAVELSYGRGGITLERFGQVVLPEGAIRDGEVVDIEATSQCLRQLWKATGFSHHRVVIGVANQRVIVRQLDLPWMEREELRESLAFQVQDYLPIDANQAVLDFFPLEELTDSAGARKLRGLLVAASRDTVLANVRCAEKAGLDVVSVDLTSFAVLRALGKQSHAEVETEALIDVGARVTNIVVYSGGLPRFVRILLMGGQDVTDAIAERLGVPLGHAEAMKQQVAFAPPTEETAAVSRVVDAVSQEFVDEVRGSLDYYAASNPGAPVERILISGGGSRLAGLVPRLGAATRVPVVAGDPMANLRIGRTGLDDSQLDFVKPLAAVPVGLALGAI
ncbi:MAG: type IV pilus assembly protein PilM [Kineosporiaceae bacterium]|nr:type IV pilus assembly protein PilM [Kineosporiaceae bacterium]MBK7625040.1 type IV pilus assembly protein PilM [Kineosporiaceae bacterium]MBK8076579.1 type IV pilus assembly protein PilM [Kineosporiaceae bacterium]